MDLLLTPVKAMWSLLYLSRLIFVMCLSCLLMFSLSFYKAYYNWFCHNSLYHLKPGCYVRHPWIRKTKAGHQASPRPESRKFRQWVWLRIDHLPLRGMARTLIARLWENWRVKPKDWKKQIRHRRWVENGLCTCGFVCILYGYVCITMLVSSVCNGMV